MLEPVSFVSGKAHFPLLVGRDYSEKGLGIAKTKLPLAVSGFYHLSSSSFALVQARGFNGKLLVTSPRLSSAFSCLISQ